MPRKLTPSQALQMALSPKRKRAGGRPRKPTACPKCGAQCESARKALGHC